MWQHVKLSEQIGPWDTLACCWDVKQPTNTNTNTKGKTEENWAKLKSEVDTAAKQTIDILKRHHQDWFDNDTDIQGLLGEKYAAHKNWLADRQSDSKQDKLHRLRRKVQKLHG